MTRVQYTVNGLALMVVRVAFAEADADRSGEDARLNGSPRLKPGDFNLKLHPKPRKEVPNV